VSHDHRERNRRISVRSGECSPGIAQHPFGLRGDLTDFSRFLGDVAVETITADQIRKYLIPYFPSRDPPASARRHQGLLPLSGNHWSLSRNPTRTMRLRKRDSRLPSVLSEDEVEDFIGKERPEDDDPVGWRDRALVKTLHSYGLRVPTNALQLKRIEGFLGTV
jgi:site-specific recombinase XerD